MLRKISPFQYPPYAWKWNFYSQEVLPMWVADMDFPPPIAVQKAVTDYGNQAYFGYGLTQNQIYESIQKWIYNQHQITVSTKEILLCNGVISAMKTYMSNFMQPGENYLTFTPIYPPFLNMETTFPIEARQIPLSYQNHSYSIDFKAFKKSIDSKTRFLLLSNPHNPSGNVWTKQELTQILQLCQKYHIHICSDEIWSDLIFNSKKFHSLYSLTEQDLSTSVSFMAPSKTFNLAGLNFSFCLIKNQETKQKMKKYLDAFSITSNIMAEKATTAAYQQGFEWLTNVKQQIAKNHKTVTDFFAKNLPLLKIIPSHSTYLVWIDCSALNQKDPYAFFLKEALVAFRHAKDFGNHYSQFVRLNIACTPQILEEALKRILFCLKNHK